MVVSKEQRFCTKGKAEVSEMTEIKADDEVTVPQGMN